MSEPEIRWTHAEIPKGWEAIARSMPAFTCACGTLTHYGWKKDGVRWCEACGEKQFVETGAQKLEKEAGKPKKARRKL